MSFNESLPSWLQVVSIVFLVTSIAIAFIIVFEKRSPYKTVAWILALVIIPIFGLIFYLFFGQEYRKRKMYSRKGLKGLGRMRQVTSKQLREFQENQLDIKEEILEKEKIIRLLLNNSHSPLTTGNKVEILNNGDEVFQSIMAEIEKAKHHIHIQSYIIDDDKIGNELRGTLIEKCQAGVMVRVLVDDVGSWSLGKKYVSSLRQAGVQFDSFMKVRFPRLTPRLNYRNHRKIIVIDGQVGFTGGINVADRYKEGNKKVGSWRDTHIKIEGDAVSCLQVIFAADWFFVTKDVLEGKKYFEPFTEGKGLPVQVVSSGPDSDWESISQAFFAAIASAKKYVYLTSPYLIPPQPMLAALKTAALGDIDIRVIIPEKSDARISKWCSFSFVEELLEAGVKVYFYQKGFIHCKLLMVDDILCTVGSTNLDFRSLETNFEVNAFMYDKAFTKELSGYFLEDIKNSKRVKLKEWQQRPWTNKLRESFAHIVSPML